VAKTADTLYRNGDVLTLDEVGGVAEALAVRVGRIQALGSEAEVRRCCGPNTEEIDLGGGALLPGFVDPHGHLAAVARAMASANLAPPPAGPVETMADLQAALRRHLEANAVASGEWVVGQGYDDSMLAERRHPSRDDLDAVSTAHPILVAHASGHLFAANSRTLELAGFRADTPDPEGGVIRRRGGSREPNGVLEEMAGFAVAARTPVPSDARRLELLYEAQLVYAGAGFTTVQDGATLPGEWQLLERAAADGRLAVDVVSYPLFPARAPAFASGIPRESYAGRLRIGGVKLLLDGSPQGKTAWLSEPYAVPPDGQPGHYRGYPLMKDEDLASALDVVLEEDLQLLAHTNGDQAAQQLIDQLEAAQARTGARARRPVMVHAQTVRDDQLDRMAALGLVPSFFVSHTFFWGDWHRDSVLGPERAARISPVRSAIERGMRFTFHNDAPVTPPDALRLVWSAVNRRTRSGAVLGEAQRVGVLDALRGVTSHAAWQYGEERAKGTLEFGKAADLVILSANPLRVAPEDLLSIEVLQTIKDGELLWSRPATG
jgi:predicted amidohydrolase YtcJ